jgi:hypothetical protein
MKPKSKDAANADELRPDYNLGELLKKGVQGKYAERYREETNLILPASDLAKVFSTEDAVNEALRLVIHLRRSG